MIVAGIMSGTSADGIDVALVRLRAGGSDYPKLELLAHEAFPYPTPLRKAVRSFWSRTATMRRHAITPPIGSMRKRSRI